MNRIPIQDRGPGRQHTPPVPSRPTHEPEPVHEPQAAHEPVATAWVDYLAAARQLDGIRRGAATAAGEQARAVQIAREELATVRARLAGQEARLRASGVPPISLVPTPPELSAVSRSMASGPATVLAALRVAAGRVDAADTALATRRMINTAGWPVVARNLLGYAPLALLMPFVQLVLLAVTGPSPLSAAALVVGLAMPARRFAAGWWWVGRLAGPDAAVSRTAPPRLGVLVCLVPAVLASTVLLLALLG
ncbi:hypothetical protein HCB18_16575 [Salinispora arenicola]|uniref:hypothetical protein n=1 Tax=Salinispora arenicola TaxID=168697 RepID=UPI00169DD89A|nr:hypothetical protein [Salinispora arenicola]NIL58373.1 hypothetical protein [Salinispora arenicola]